MRRLRLRDAHLRHTAPRFQILETWRWADERKRATDFLSFLSSPFFFYPLERGKLSRSLECHGSSLTNNSPPPPKEGLHSIIPVIAFHVEFLLELLSSRII